MTKRKVTSYTVVKNRKCSYIFWSVGKELTHLTCESAKVDQDFPNTDFPALLLDLPELIISEQEYQKINEQVLRFRISSDDKKKIEEKAVRSGYRSVSAFLRDLALNA